MNLEETFPGMKCPLRFAKFISKKDEVCQVDCAWLIRDQEGHAACAIPWMVSGQVGGLISYMDSEIEEEEE